jgi:hypothetical protein
MTTRTELIARLRGMGRYATGAEPVLTAAADMLEADNKLRAAAKLAKDALVYHTEQTRPIDRTDKAITALKEAGICNPICHHS